VELKKIMKHLLNWTIQHKRFPQLISSFAIKYINCSANLPDEPFSELKQNAPEA
jgi:hypothetical protein